MSSPAALAANPDSAAERDAWLRLLTTPGLGRSATRKLLAAFGSAQAVWTAEPAARLAVAGPAVAAALAVPPPSWAGLCERTADWLAAGTPEAPRRVMTLADADYPAPLLHAPDPPLMLHLQGRVELLTRPGLAVVGSRHATPQGLELTTEFAAALARQGLCIVSGLALGIDAAAHTGALDAGGASVAVVGTGLDRVYPQRHHALAHRLAVQGLLVSEFPLGTPPLADHFPMRNRIIAGLTLGTLVVEAAMRSGSLITARLAAESGREVFALPGSVRAPQSRGCHHLIRQGASLVETPQDILDELGFATPTPAAPADAVVSPADRPRRSGPRKATVAAPSAVATSPDSACDAPPDLLDALGHDPVMLDVLMARTGQSAQALGAALLQLELDGHVARLPGQLFQRVGVASG